MNKDFRLPDVGEGLTEADIVSWHVKPGDTVTINQVIVEIETAKAVVELPSPYAGTVSALLVSEGQTVDVGIPIITIDVPVAGDAPAADSAPAEAEPQPPAAATPAATAPPARQPVLVGYGVKPGSTSRRPRKSAPTRPGSYPASPAAPENGGPLPGTGPAGPAGLIPPPGPASLGGPSRTYLAKPPVRRLARDLGIDLTGLTGSGPEGSVTKEDVQKAVNSRGDSLPASGAPAPDHPRPPYSPGHAQWRGNDIGHAGEATDRSTPRSLPEVAGGPHAVAELSPAGTGAAEERIPVRGVRKHTAAAMVASAFTAPHVTEFLQVDVTETMAAVRRARELAEFAGVKVSPLLFVAKALLVAVRRHPMINSSWDEAAQEIVVKRSVNLGIAVAAERGLLVPNVKGADALALADLARALDAMASTARAGKATPEDLAGGTITITNVGVFGVDAGTPILLPGEAAILAFGQVRDLPWVVDGALAVRKVTTLSLSFDHRIVDGELGSAVLRDVGSMLADPVRMLAWS
jgi:2-oxoisovalerate dehydrogenase E2 component (dihydrolipoyl transacylase)